MSRKTTFFIFCVIMLNVLRPFHCLPVSNQQAIQLDVTPGSGYGNLEISCKLDASLTSMEQTTSLTIYAIQPYSRQGQFDPLVTVDLWSLSPQLLGGISTSDVDVFGKIGIGGGTKSRLSFSWKTPRNTQASRYKCVANGLETNRNVVTVSVTSAASPSGSRPGLISTAANLGAVTQTILDGVANSTEQVRDRIQDVDTDIAALQQKVNALGEMATGQNSSIADLQERLSSFTQLYKFTYLMSNFDVSDVFRGRRYYVSKVVAPFNIQAADSLCSMLDGYLVEINSMDEFNFVHKFVKHVGGSGHFFTGGNDIEEEGVWRFWHSKKLVNFFNWKVSSQPDNAGGIEDCIEIRLSHKGFNDWVCNSKAKFVCEGHV
ncbi:lectin C-type domain containing protein [Elysia marginata]|uniref:Lectin C-type domain containing protein n=1 Tax=Elysia marginata TaxID=1093978 RepID=A0AAV4EYG4_9GAST|nr:lectin C-type domain containing protein [Elysia marginata]